MSHEAPLTVEEFKEAMPAHVRKNINPELMDQINGAVSDPEVLSVFRENVLGLTTVMKEGKFKIESYLYAVKFVSHKLLGDNNITAWAKTFRTRYNDMIGRGCTRSEIAAVTSRYASSKLVILMMGQTMMPTHILNAPLFQEALNVQAELMRSANSEMVRSQAAGKLMEILKPPEVAKVELDIKVGEDETIKALRESTMALVGQQQRMLEAGEASVRTVAESRLVHPGDNAIEVEAEVIR